MSSEVLYTEESLQSQLNSIYAVFKDMIREEVNKRRVGKYRYPNLIPWKDATRALRVAIYHSTKHKVKANNNEH